MTKVPFNRPALVGREINYIRDAVQRGQLAGDGYHTKACNAEIQRLTSARKAMLTHSCTAALEMAAILCDLRPGDEVIMPSFTFVSTANAVALRGATPVFVDIDPISLNLDTDRVVEAVTDRSKAIFAVHYAGYPAEMDRLAEIAVDKDMLVVEDAAQALGSTYKGRPAGSLGDLAAISFHETKNIISGEGGALCINRDDLIERAEIIREKGTDRSRFIRGQVDKYTWVDLGSSYLPGELVAAYLHAQLEVAEMINVRRISIFERYMEAFLPLEAQGKIQVPKAIEGSQGNGHMFFLLLNSSHERNAFIEHMGAAGIIAPFHYIPLHSAPAGLKYGRASGDLSVTDRVSETLVRLPMFFDLGADVERVVDVATDFFVQARREA